MHLNSHIKANQQEENGYELNNEDNFEEKAEEAVPNADNSNIHL